MIFLSNIKLLLLAFYIFTNINIVIGATGGTICDPYIVVVYPTDSSVSGANEGLLLNAIDDQIIDHFNGQNVTLGLVSFNSNEEIESLYLNLLVGGNDALLSSALTGTSFSILSGSDWGEALADGPGDLTDYNPIPDFVIFIASDNPSDLPSAVLAADNLKSNGAQIMAIGVGGTVTVSNLQSISGNEEGKDYIQTTDFTTLESDLAIFRNSVLCCDGLKDNCGLCNGTSTCDDLDPCTLNDMCNATGVCVGTPMVCPITDSDPCTVDECVSGVCQNNINSGGACDDGVVCTENDLCDAFGQCSGTAIVCDDGIFCDGPEFCTENPNSPGQPLCVTGPFPNCTDGQLCTEDICNFSSDQCENPPLQQIGQFCGVTDVGPCEFGVYVCNETHGLYCFGNVDPMPEDCGTSGLGNGIDENCNGIADETCGAPCNLPADCDPLDCYSVSCVNDVCEYTLLPDGTICDDGLNCTANDTCTQGTCSGVLDCDDGNICTEDVCSTFDGECENLFQLTSCDDGNGCTDGDTCQINGTQVFCLGIPIPCDDGNSCTDDSCEPSTGICSSVNVADGLVCQDSNLCTENDTCQSGNCTSGPMKDCDDQNICTNDTCINGDCFYQYNTLSCDDLNACTENDACDTGMCEGTQLICNDSNICTIDTCDVNTGCIFTNAANGTVQCDDADLCTTNDVCIDGICVGEPVICDDQNECTSNNCTNNMCVFTPLNGTSCDDGDSCTILDICINGTCTGTPMDCTDGNNCTTDVCISGSCFNFANTDPCDDFDACTENDTCDSTVCVGIPITCNDTNQCTNDTCDTVLGCIFTNTTGGTCDDLDPCTINDVCLNGLCVGTQMECNDSNICTDDICFNGQCVFFFNSNPCDDGNPCENDTCSGGVCVPGPPMDCNDSNICTDDFCDAILGCQNVNITNSTLSCDDLDPCTFNDVCVNGTCIGTPIICTDGNPCTNDSCSGGFCVFSPISGGGFGICSDGNPCTENDTCINGFCVGSEIICTDNDSCTDSFCTNGMCINVNNDTLTCDDLNPCTLNDTCIQGQCVGIQKDCSDTNACTQDFCEAITGMCMNLPTLTTPCDDGKFMYSW